MGMFRSPLDTILRPNVRGQFVGDVTKGPSSAQGRLRNAVWNDPEFATRMPELFDASAT
jgi:hypothetical protein